MSPSGTFRRPATVTKPTMEATESVTPASHMAITLPMPNMVAVTAATMPQAMSAPIPTDSRTPAPVQRLRAIHPARRQAPAEPGLKVQRQIAAQRDRLLKTRQRLRQRRGLAGAE